MIIFSTSTAGVDVTSAYAIGLWVVGGIALLNFAGQILTVYKAVFGGYASRKEITDLQEEHKEHRRRFDSDLARLGEEHKEHRNQHSQDLAKIRDGIEKSASVVGAELKEFVRRIDENIDRITREAQSYRKESEKSEHELRNQVHSLALSQEALHRTINNEMNKLLTTVYELVGGKGGRGGTVNKSV